MQSRISTQQSPGLAKTLLETSIESLKDVLIFSIDRDFCYLNFNTAFKKATAQAYGSEVAIGKSMLDSITAPTDRKKAKKTVNVPLLAKVTPLLKSLESWM